MKPISHSYFAGFFMAAIAGFSDVFGFIALDRLFTAHITGNIVIIISSLIYDTAGIVPKVIAIPVFMLFAIVISAIIEQHSYTKKALVFWLLLEVFFFTALLAFGVSVLPGLPISSVGYIGITILPICSMAIHNTLLRTYMAKLPPCTVMTGNLTHFIVDLTAICLNKFSVNTTLKENALFNVKRFGNVLLGFVFGGLLSTFGFIFMGFYALIFIVLLLIILLRFLKTVEII